MSEEKLSDLMKELNPAQQEAVSTVEGPAMVVAGAGSGKTRVITYRIPYLLLSGAAHSDNILALTFTNKAAGEMKERVADLAGSEFQPPRISTFHSFGALFLRRHIGLLGFNTRFVIYDEDDQLNVLKEASRELNLNETRYNPRDLQSLLKWQKSSVEQPEIYEPLARNAFALYEKKLRASNAIDFEDLLILPLKILLENPHVRQRYYEIYRFLMVDEYQDTNEIQYEWLKTLAGERANLMVVGDEDQSIYKFRGARTQNIQHFLQDFPKSRIIKLEQNYRSTKTIIKAAQAVISNNSSRIKKELWTENAAGEPLEIYHAFDEYDEAAYVTLRIMAFLKEMQASDIAILYRANAQSRVLEESLMKAEIPYRIVGAVGFYQRREIKDLVAFLRLKTNPDDALSFLRIVNVPPRGIGKKNVEQIQMFAETRQSSLFQAAKLSGNKSLLSFLELYNSPLESLSPSGFLESVLQSTGYFEYLQKEDPLSAMDRIDNINEFLSFLREKEAQPDFDLGTFMSELPLQSAEEKSGEAVTLLTVHSAKGLEFRNLFVVGLEEGMFPHIRSMDASEDLQEERRLFYVALTRAMQRIVLSWAQRRGIYGSTLSGRPSRFLEEIPPWFKINRISERFGAANFDRRPSDDLSEFRVGSKVHHEKFGRGTVISVEGVPNDWKLTIRFLDGVKKILTRYAHLTVEK